MITIAYKVMPGDEIAVPKELREFMLDGAQETNLGHKNGATKQYRYGNLHIREYEDKFLVHTDRFDPRQDPIRHLVYDAPEVLVGITCGLLSSQITNKLKGNSKNTSLASSVFSSIVLGYLGYSISKKIKEYLE